MKQKNTSNADIFKCTPLNLPLEQAHNADRTRNVRAKMNVMRISDREMAAD